MGQTYVLERSVDEIADKLLKPTSGDDENSQDPDKQEKRPETTNDSNRDMKALDTNSQPMSKEKTRSVMGKESADGDEQMTDDDQKAHELEADVVVNDFLDKAAELPPRDPDGEQTILPDLIISKERIVEILNHTMQIVQEWYLQEKQVYN